MPALFFAAIAMAVLAVLFGIAWLVTHYGAKSEADTPPPATPPTTNQGGRYDQYERRPQTPSDPIRASDVLPWMRGVCLFFIGFTGLLLFASSYTVVSTKNVGIETSFGRPVDSLSNGFHLIAPWDKVTEIDAAIQTDSHVKEGNSNNCISVRIAHQAVACVDASIRWRIEDGAADALFQNYRDFSNIRESLVTRELNAALNNAFEAYDPLAVDENGNSTAISLNDLSANVTKQMQGEIGKQVNVLSVIIPVVHFDGDTQNRVNALQAQIAQTRIAQQAEKTAADQAEANRQLSSSVSNDPNVLVSKCYDLVNEMIAKSQPVPIGFSCWPGSSSAVVVPSTGTPASK